ncbi:hypothetical protein PDESU_02562 [Pontiella desulfatans]|uniref:PEP-CTERM protein-sorting domain-containing protein n=1 Tax=Pontiella desulfatans TaxID=2750659 RepID=A0A6C2U2D7_PONDE|nr:hypothetical protein [Pontiella desulfatans]VGO14005.1 hypothetical protein PDESU_02562 [Pontiella desulfatans]
MRKRILYHGITALILVAGSASASVIWSEGFNSGFSSPYSASFGAPVFGSTGPGIQTDGSLAGIEGDGFASANSSQTNVNGVASILSGMDISLGAVAEAGVTYTFSGDFGWRFGSVAAASDLAVHANQSGFRIDGTKVSGPSSNFVFGDLASSQSANNLGQLTFDYTTVAGDVGKDILVRIRIVDEHDVGTLTQLLSDNWQVTAIPEPATLGMVAAFGGTVLFIRRRFMI